MNLNKLMNINDAIMTIKEQERQLIENGVITKSKLKELINKFEYDFDEIPINIDYKHGQDIKWNRIKVGVEIGKYFLKVDYLYAGFIDTKTGEVALDIDDGGAWIYESDGYNRRATDYEDAVFSFMGGQEREFVDTIIADFEKYVRNNYKKYFKKRK